MGSPIRRASTCDVIGYSERVASARRHMSPTGNYAGIAVAGGIGAFSTPAIASRDISEAMDRASAMARLAMPTAGLAPGANDYPESCSRQRIGE